MTGGDFGDDDVGGPDNVIPFGRMKPDERIAALWSRERDAVNARDGKAYRLRGPLEALDDLIRKRALPPLPWPKDWPELGKRAVLYPGEIVAIAGPSGGGKTSFAIQMARAAAAELMPVLWLPLELDDAEVDLRIVANVARTHTRAIREGWERNAIENLLLPVADRWHYVDRMRDPADQLAAIGVAVKLAKRVYQRAPLLVVDYVGKFARGSSRDPRLVLADAIEWIRAMTVEEECYTALLSQTSRGNNATLTGKVDLDSAADAIGVSAETAELEHAASVNLALNVFKADDADELAAHLLVSKARGTGREGRQGFTFHKPGGFWGELDHLPPTPGEVTAEVKRNTKKGSPAPDVKETRADLNFKRAAEASAKRREIVLGALRKAGLIGLGGRELRKVPGAGRAQKLTDTLDDLARAGDAEKLDNGRWRIIPK